MRREKDHTNPRLFAPVVAIIAGCSIYLPQIYPPMEIIWAVVLGLMDAFYLWVAVNNVKVLKS